MLLSYNTLPENRMHVRGVFGIVLGQDNESSTRGENRKRAKDRW